MNSTWMCALKITAKKLIILDDNLITAIAQVLQKYE